MESMTGIQVSVNNPKGITLTLVITEDLLNKAEGPLSYEDAQVFLDGTFTTLVELLAASFESKESTQKSILRLATAIFNHQREEKERLLKLEAKR